MSAGRFRLIDNLSLVSLEEYLRHTTKIGLLHNADDIILDAGELDYLVKVFGQRAKIYPRGGHCGNLAHHVTLAYIVDFFRSPITANPVLTTTETLRTPKPISTGFPIHQALDPKETPPRVTQDTSFLSYFDLHAQLDQDIELLERKLEESQAYLQGAQVRQILSENILETSLPFNAGTVSDSEPKAIKPARRPLEDVVRPDIRYPIEVYDPLETMNRAVYKFNAQFDEFVFLPVVEGYETVMPNFFEDRISNFFSNIADVRNLLNAMLQLKGKTTLKTLGRFLINCTFGLGGFFDHATPLGLPQQMEDFGQTLGHYGLNPGPYLVLPIFGPSSLRDTTGLMTDSLALYLYLYIPADFNTHILRGTSYTSTNSVDTRHQLSFRYYQTGSPFEYDLVRFLYTKKRELEIGK